MAKHHGELAELLIGYTADAYTKPCGDPQRQNAASDIADQVTSLYFDTLRRNRIENPALLMNIEEPKKL